MGGARALDRLRLHNRVTEYQCGISGVRPSIGIRLCGAAAQVFTGCGKPGFFHAPKPIYEVQTPTGLLANTDGGSPMTAIGDRRRTFRHLNCTARCTSKSAAPAATEIIITPHVYYYY